MIHPDTRIRYINDEIGYGIFATRLIPKGTMIYVKDSLELEVSPKDFEKHHPQVQGIIEKYSYMDERGVRIVSWDFAKYVNHCCDSNTLCTGYGFDVAVRDILEGEELTCEYGLLNVADEMPLLCNRPGCRGILKPSDFKNYYPLWDKKVKSVLVLLNEVKQPLSPFLQKEVAKEVQEFLKNGSKYKSVWTMKYKP